MSKEDRDAHYAKHHAGTKKEPRKLPRQAFRAKQLLALIEKNPGQLVRDYARRLGVSSAATGTAAKTLIDAGYIFRSGNRASVKYHLVNWKNGNGNAHKQPAKPQVEATISPIAIRRILVDKETGEEFVYENGTLYREVITREVVK
jgi:DNA-binding Lrp family transcriptional regulator